VPLEFYRNARDDSIRSAMRHFGQWSDRPIDEPEEG